MFWLPTKMQRTEIQAVTDAGDIVGSNLGSGFSNIGRGILTYVFEDDHFDGSSTTWPGLTRLRFMQII